jgi:methane/ammonia monooxygenase subunit B
MMVKIRNAWLRRVMGLILVCILSGVVLAPPALAHGEIAQMAGIRMRTIHWFDTQIEPLKVQVNDIVTVRGKFMVSGHWPDYVAKPEEWVFLNIGVPGPVFVRLDATINGMPQYQSTAFRRGEFYEYEVKLKARVPGEWHLHPLINVWEAGPLAGPAKFVQITGNKADFVNTVTLMDGEKVDVEHYGLASMWSIHLLWVVVGLLWVAYWFRHLPVMMRRYVAVKVYGELEAERHLITIKDMVVSVGFVLGILGITLALMLWSMNRYAITMPLQTGKVEAPIIPLPESQQQVDVKVQKAQFDLPSRRLDLALEVTNRSSEPVRIGQFVTGYARFVDAAVIKDVKSDRYDPVAPNGLHSDVTWVEAGQTRLVNLTVADALWGEHRLTDIVAEPDLRFAGLLFFYTADGHRHVREIGARMTPNFLPGYVPVNRHGGHVARKTEESIS